MLKLVRECVDDEYDAPFQLSVDVIMCLMNKDVISKQFILSIVNQLSFKNVGRYGISRRNSSRKLIEMMKLLLHDFECLEVELNKVLENVHFRQFEVFGLNEFKYAKCLASVDVIILDGDMATITTRDICKEIDGINECVKIKEVSIVNCKLEDEDIEDKITKSYKLEWLCIRGCYVTEQGFFNLLKWMITVEQCILNDIEEMKGKWWNMLVEAVVSAKKKNDGNLSLRKLWIKDCPYMKDEIKEKVITFMLIHNYCSFIIICKWFSV